MGEKMNENSAPRERSSVESTLYQATKHLRVITDADLVAVVDGRTVEAGSAARIDIAFPPSGSTDHLFN